MNELVAARVECADRYGLSVHSAERVLIRVELHFFVEGTVRVVCRFSHTAHV